MFEIKDKDGLARIGKLTIGNKSVKTPYLMPVINPNLPLPSIKELTERFEIPMLITNAYIIFKNEELKEKCLEEGIHKTLGFDGIIETDSGAFQLFQYGDLEISNKEIVEFQEKIGVDIANPLDIPSDPNDIKEICKLKCKETLKRINEAKDLLLNSKMSLPIQGGIYLDLREWFCKEVKNLMNYSEIIAAGGIVPLLEDQRFVEITKILLIIRKTLGLSKPLHVFGAGHPMVFPLLVACGADLFDSAAYIIYAKEEKFLFPWGTRKLEELSVLPCECPICSKYTKEELLEMKKEERIKLISFHNLYISYTELKRIKQFIAEGTFHEYLEYRCSSHPKLMDALKVLYEEISLLKSLAKVNKRKGLKLTHELSLRRPELLIYKEKLKNIEIIEHDIKVVRELPEDINIVEKIVLEEQQKHKEKKVLVMFKTPFGEIPWYAIDVFPFSQLTISSHLKKKVNNKHNDSEIYK